jgi:polyferredoxin
MLKRRIISQAIFMLLFIFFASFPALIRGGEWFFRANITALGGSYLSTLSITVSIVFSLVLVIITLFFGRVFCGWACPLGALADIVDYAFRLNTKGEKLQAVKYHLLIIFIVFSFFGMPLFWTLDPLNWATRILGVFSTRYIDFIPLLVLIFLFFTLHLVFGRRAFCRILCPLGASLGVIAKFSFFKRELDIPACTDCDLCVTNNRSYAISPRPENYNSSECFQCRECEAICPTKAISFKYVRK